jgi:hypothetical protein
MDPTGVYPWFWIQKRTPLKLNICEQFHGSIYLSRSGVLLLLIHGSLTMGEVIIERKSNAKGNK